MTRRRLGKRSTVSEEQLNTLERMERVSTQEDTRTISTGLDNIVTMNPTKARFITTAVEQRISRLITGIEEIHQREQAGERIKEGNLTRKKFEVKTLKFFLQELDRYLVDDETNALVDQLRTANVSESIIASVIADRRHQR